MLLSRIYKQISYENHALKKVVFSSSSTFADEI